MYYDEQPSNRALLVILRYPLILPLGVVLCLLTLCLAVSLSATGSTPPAPPPLTRTTAP